MIRSIFSRLTAPVLELPRVAKRVVAVMVDMSLCVLTVWLAYYMRLGEFVTLSGNAFIASIISMIVCLVVFTVFGLYRAIFRYSDWPALLTVARAVLVYGLIYSAIFTAIGANEVPRTVGIIQPILLLLFVAASRTLARMWLGEPYQNIIKRSARSRVLIYGAGRTGRQLAAAMANSPEMHVVAFLDDDMRLVGNVLNGLQIYNPLDIESVCASLSISTVLLAMPRISRTRRNQILGDIRSAQVSVRTLPSFNDLAEGKVKFSDLRELDIDDLLGRDPVQPDPTLLAKNNRGKVVLVTGAGGSIGSELCRQILTVMPHTLLLIEQSEFALYSIHEELVQKPWAANIKIIPFLASVQDYERMNEIMRASQPQTIYHAAAYKHVPLVEHNPAEGLKNNVFGTLQVARAAMTNGVTDFVLVSTDKAVRPTNVMGASKRLAEMILQALAATEPKTNFVIVRFGNVLGSSGSVVPKFREQIRNGGPITLTHAEITRYFMTIPEAAQLVIQAGAIGSGGDVCVLDMGAPVKIMDLACQMIQLSGLTVRDDTNPDGDIQIEITGLRPGEKLFEELLIGRNPAFTMHPRIMKAHEEYKPLNLLELDIESLYGALDRNSLPLVRALLKEIVPEYVPNDDLVDWVYLANREQ
jgi:FlaA1/EpsC-like NDP-sugar epimerase